MDRTWRESRVTQTIFTILRLYVAYQWISSGAGKLFGAESSAWVGSQAGTAITGFFKGALTKTAGAHPDVSWWYGGFIQHIALPNAKVFSYIISYGEFLAGIAILIGFLTNIALLAAILMNLNYLMAGTISSNPLLLLLEVILLWGGVATYYFGVDRVFIPRWRRYRMDRQKRREEGTETKS